MKQRLRVSRCECCGRYMLRCIGGYLTAEEILAAGLKPIGNGLYEFIDQEQGEEWYKSLQQGELELTKDIAGY